MDPNLIEALRAAFEVSEVESGAAADRLAGEDPTTLVLLPTEMIQEYVGRMPPESAAPILQHIGEGVGVVDAEGTITWASARLGDYSEQVRARFAELCRQAVALLNQDEDLALPIAQRHCRKFSFASGERHYELVTSPASTDPTDDRTVTSVVGVLWDVTASRNLLDKLDAVDAAGSELMKLDADAIRSLNAIERLQLLADKIIHYVHDLLHFDNFEIRLLDRETNRLELVMARGIAPERIGEVLSPEAEGSGITGYVAATGESYLCPNVQEDPLYREGLDEAASSLTVPLKLHDRVIGVFNIESKTSNAFDENDRQFATIFGRYIAMAMNILDLLVVERYTTNEQLAQNVLGELDTPLAEITDKAKSLRETNLADGPTRKGLEEIIDAVGSVRRRIETVAAGPHSILGAEQELQSAEPDPAMIGKRILIADDDAAIRKSVGAILAQRGCDVTICGSGEETIETIRALHGRATDFDLIISDIKMPDRSGYEVFSACMECSPTTPVILMTGFGYDPHHSIVRASQEGLQSFLFKPFKAKQLLSEVRKALEGEEKDG
ncbi:MAG: response regulator [Planctomycetota bacterium]